MKSKDKPEQLALVFEAPVGARITEPPDGGAAERDTRLVAHLERAAVSAGKHGESWRRFWRKHADEVRAAEPWCQRRFRQLVNHLMNLVMRGSTDARWLSAADATPPWENDDGPAECVSDMQQLLGF